MKRLFATFLLSSCMAAVCGAASEEEFARMDKLLTIGGCRIVDFESFLSLLSPNPDGAYAVTNRQYSPPFVVKARARTDSTNIRFYYSSGMIILNWEVTLNELRFHNLDTGWAVGIPGKGSVSPMVWHDIVWEVRPSSTRLLVDGEERLNALGEYAELKAPIGIGPAQGSMLMLESLTVAPLEAEPAE